MINRVLEEWSDRVRAERDGAVGDAIAYSLSAPGKRLRPALFMAAYREIGGNGDAAELAASIEVVHTYSLVHDDLPCMDDDDWRRGQPTAHRKFDVPTATEAAFRMVPLAGRVLASGAERLGLSVDAIRAIATELFTAAGAGHMIRGQVLDLEAEGAVVSRESLIEIHQAKTGALITASVVMGALAAGARGPLVEEIRAYGREIGLAFQIVDDVLDATGTLQQLGKTAGKDAEQHKATYANVVGVDEGMQQAKRHITKGIAHLATVKLDSGLLGSLARFIAERQS